MATAHPIMRSFLNNPGTAKIWANLGERLLREKIETWCETRKAVPLFHEISTLVMTVVMYAIMGNAFADKYAKELIPIVQAYEVALQTPESKALPWWASKAGRIIKSAERRLKELLDEEVKFRLQNRDKFKDNVDFLQDMLNQRDRHEGITLRI